MASCLFELRGHFADVALRQERGHRIGGLVLNELDASVTRLARPLNTPLVHALAQVDLTQGIGGARHAIKAYLHRDVGGDLEGSSASLGVGHDESCVDHR